MRIYKMTATFGKLEQQTLTLEPGLNVIQAPNEWGKTTWCAFLITMFYGLDTRAKSTKTALADKERYAPWSGSPMAGRIDLNWDGRDITIERRTKGRTPLGVFRAYETASGLDVPELTAANCGQLLLGVEQSVYRRTGFVRQSDMPVTQDDALRRRLNALVTTGDETGDSDTLAEELKNLRNKCRYNRSGLLPQAEAQQKLLEDKLAELDALEVHSKNLAVRLTEVKNWRHSLENHRDALAYEAAQADQRRVAEARQLKDRAEEILLRMDRRCAGQPQREEVERKLQAMEAYREDLEEFHREEASCAPYPQIPVPPEQFRGMTLEQAADMVERDTAQHIRLSRTPPWVLLLVLATVLLILAVPAALMEKFVIAAMCGVLGAALLILGLKKRGDWNRGRIALEEKYGSGMPEAWQMQLNRYRAEKEAFDQAVVNYRADRGDLDIRRTFLQRQRESIFGQESPEEVMAVWKQKLKALNDRDAARRELQQAEKYLKGLQAMAKQDAQPPAMADVLTQSAPETERLLLEAYAEQQRLQNRLGQYQGRMEALGDRGAIEAQLQVVQQRIGKLEETYDALTLALDTLAEARQSLQRKFAPRISGCAQELLSRMTDGRYDRLAFREDLSLLAGADREETLHEALWRSDGTVDQLYLSLRLAVAEELIPQAPLVLDDAFVRFDDTRLKAALEILKELSQKRQVILFTCQQRETEML